MIEELLEWNPSRKLRDIGTVMDDIYIDFSLLWQSFGEPKKVPNKHLANRLLHKINHYDNELSTITPKTKFDKLVFKDFQESLLIHKAWIQLFCTKKGSTEYGVRNLLNMLFVPKNTWDKENDASNYIKNSLKKMRYQDKTKRDKLMNGIETFRIDSDYDTITRKIRKEIPKIKKVLRKFDVEKEFVTQEQAGLLEIIDIKNEVRDKIETYEDIFGITYENFPFTFKELIFKATAEIYDQYSPSEIKEIFDNEIEIPENIDFEYTKLLDFDLNNVLIYDYNASFDPSVKIMELGNHSFFFYKDKDTDEIKVYRGDVFRNAIHENIHRLQAYFSRGMPAGLNFRPGAVNFFARTVEEGLARHSENIFHRYFEENREELGLTKTDLKRAEWESKIYLQDKLIKIYHSILHREQDVEATDYEVHQILVKHTGNWGLIDTISIDDDDLSETIHFGWYIFGERHMADTINCLEKKIKKKLKTKDNRTVRRFMKRNESVLMQCLMTGYWGWSTHKDFVLNHALPRAWKYMN